MPSFPLGPDGEPVNDSFYFVHQPLTGDGSITVRVTSLTGLRPAADDGSRPASTATRGPALTPWAKAGIIIKENLEPRAPRTRRSWSPPATGCACSGTTPGTPRACPAPVGPANPRWLRLTRSGDVITGYDSADGTHWSRVGAVTLAGLPSTAQVGLFAALPRRHGAVAQSFGGGTSQNGSGPTQATAVFDHVTSAAGRRRGPAGTSAPTTVRGSAATTRPAASSP